MAKYPESTELIRWRGVVGGGRAYYYRPLVQVFVRADCSIVPTR